MRVSDMDAIDLRVKSSIRRPAGSVPAPATASSQMRRHQQHPEMYHTIDTHLMYKILPTISTEMSGLLKADIGQAMRCNKRAGIDSPLKLADFATP